MIPIASLAPSVLQAVLLAPQARRLPTDCPAGMGSQAPFPVPSVRMGCLALYLHSQVCLDWASLMGSQAPLPQAGRTGAMVRLLGAMAFPVVNQACHRLPLVVPTETCWQKLLTW